MKARNLYLIAMIVAIFDQLTKLAVLKHLPLGSSVPVLGSLIYFTSVRNPGGAFGTFQSSTGPLTLVTVATVIGIAVLVRRQHKLPAVLGVALSLLLGGALGNLIDRVRLHHVIDFIDLKVWPVFNVADCAITIAIVVLGYHMLFVERRSNTATGEAEK